VKDCKHCKHYAETFEQGVCARQQERPVLAAIMRRFGQCGTMGVLFEKK
jgi:hypothetical protein